MSREAVIDKLNMRCPTCARPLVVRRRRADDAEFLGCTGWPDHCRHTKALPETVRMRRMGAPELPGIGGGG